jgi:predicted HicB family RNase H-like nuclease
MEINPRPLVAKKLKEMAAKEGISLNALIVPYLNDIADGRLVRGYSYQEPLKPQ